YHAGAKRIISFDYDPDSVATTCKVREMAGNPTVWEVFRGSVLDGEFIDKLGKADIVYSWGVLHHTGDMWKAVQNAASCLKPDGMFYIALYTSDICIHPTPEYWLRIKREYNMAGPLKRKWMEIKYACQVTIFPELLHGRNPLKYILEYSKSRGM